MSINRTTFKASCSLVKQQGAFFVCFLEITFVCVVAHLSSELFDTGQFNDSSLGGGCSCQLLFFILVLLFPGSFSVS